jgi:hypothetical protein
MQTATRGPDTTLAIAASNRVNPAVSARAGFRLALGL